MDWWDNLFWKERQVNANQFSHYNRKKRYFKNRTNLKPEIAVQRGQGLEHPHWNPETQPEVYTGRTKPTSD